MQELACGSYGTIVLDTSRDRCGALKATSAANGFYPQILTATPDVAWIPAAWIPCDHGSCFTRDPRGPWVAVIDWDGPHGWSVGEMIRRTSDGRVATKLYALDSTGTAIDGSSVSDVHVLAQLCRVTEDARHHPPVAVNMSFGRSADGVAPVAREISAVVRHLREDYGIAVFAAAGNHGELLFPAADPRVLAIGSLDLGHFVAGASRPGPRTPAGATGLFPGHGLYLASPDGTSHWAAPPGSSYASAFAAGWWAGYQVGNPGGDDCRKGLGLTLANDGTAFLACGSRVLADSALHGPGELVTIALGKRPEVCNDVAFDAALAVEVDGTATDLLALTPGELETGRIRPAPFSRPCVPCHGGGGGGGEEIGTETPGPIKATEYFYIDLSQSTGLPPDVDPVGLYLRVGSTVYSFSDSENTTLLGSFALGKLDTLVIDNAPPEVYTQSVELVYTMRQSGVTLRATAENDIFYGATLVTVHDH